MKQKLILLLVTLAFVLSSCSKSSENSPTDVKEVDENKVEMAYEAMIESSFDKEKNKGYENIIPDEHQQICSKYQNTPPEDLVIKMMEEAKNSIVYPDDGKLVGDWKNGEILANIGKGGHVGYTKPDKPNAKRGGNCYACHTLDTKEVAAGTMGISLTNYGTLRKDDPNLAQFVYDKIYNSYWLTPCSSMPRFGTHDWITTSQIADIVAYVISPDSPVNQ